MSAVAQRTTPPNVQSISSSAPAPAGMVRESAGPGYCRYELRAGQQHLSAAGRVRGAIIYQLIETTMAEAAGTVAALRKSFFTDAEIRYVQPLNAGVYFCETKVLHYSPIHVVLETNVVTEDSVVCVRASGSFYVRS